MRPEKIAIIEKNGAGNAQLLKPAIIDSLKSELTNFPLDTVTATEVVEARPNMAFVCLAEAKLSESENGSLAARKPVQAVSLIWDLIDAGRFPVHVMVPTELLIDTPGFSALDTLALILSGASGIWESRRQLGADQDVPDMLRSQENNYRTRRVFLYGRPADQLFEFIYRITSVSWPTTTESKDSKREEYLAQAEQRLCFLAALALGGLDIADMKLPEGSTSGAEQYAKKLLGHSERTGLCYDYLYLARTLGYLIKRWKEVIVNYNVRRRNEMPLWSRTDGFPHTLPLVRGIATNDTPGYLYENLEALEFERDWEPGKSLHTTVGEIRANRKER